MMEAMNDLATPLLIQPKQHQDSYCYNKNVVGPKPAPVVGTFGPVFLRKKTAGQLIRELYKKYENGKYFGVYQGSRSMLVLRGFDLIKQVLIKDFGQFQDRGLQVSDGEAEQNLIFVVDTKITLEKGVLVFIPVSAIHHDPKYYRDPEKFDPERCSPENKSKIPSCVYLLFGGGPLNCIGMRFAKVQSTIGLAAFLNKFKVEASPKTKKNY
ncbi:Cytochrome P450 9e2 [Eumeta japonica]|uniref:unspecific monooxygenase n=1 Tax=Eumeta variegata TaxID=151549 RepID=A0A4C1X1C0_EUMVA|nr:Cytochrome P450 9e2 [Eumeta japonica]